MRNVWATVVCLLAIATVGTGQDKAIDSELLPTPVCFDGKTVYINRQGEIVLKTPYDYFFLQNHSFSEGLAGFKVGGKYGFIDTAGKVVIEPAFDYADFFSNGLAEVEINDKKGFVDRTGRVTVPIRYDKTWPFKNGFALVGVENGGDENGFVKYKWGFVDRTGQVVIGKSRTRGVGRFDDAEYFSEGLAPVKIGPRWGFANEKDVIVVKPRFREAQSFSEGMAAVTIDGKKWGFIDKKGRFVIGPKFDSAKEFSEGLAAVRLDKHKPRDWGFINKLGELVINPSFAEVAGAFKNGYALLFFGSGGFGYTDRTGKIVNKSNAGAAGNFENGVSWIYPNEYGDKYVRYGGGYIDEKGKYIWNPKEKNERFGAKCNH